MYYKWESVCVSRYANTVNPVHLIVLDTTQWTLRQSSGGSCLVFKVIFHISLIQTEHWPQGVGCGEYVRIKSSCPPFDNWYFFQRGSLKSLITEQKQNLLGHGGPPRFLIIRFMLQKQLEGGKFWVNLMNHHHACLRGSPFHKCGYGGRRCLLAQTHYLLFSVGRIWWFLVCSFFQMLVNHSVSPDVGLPFFFFSLGKVF